ncbi:MAG TPA: hypothetical protein VKR79_07490 [Gaiellaceae bacterium]|nr:hypothetical protein [Gaiellaceae bacterium]
MSTQPLEPKAFVEALSAEDLNAIAALDPGEAEFNSTMITLFPQERRQWWVDNGLAAETSEDRRGEDAQLALTERGQQVIELARELCPEPFEDVSVEELLLHLHASVDALTESSSLELVPIGERSFTRFVSGLSKSSSGSLLDRLPFRSDAHADSSR